MDFFYFNYIILSSSITKLLLLHVSFLIAICFNASCDLINAYFSIHHITYCYFKADAVTFQYATIVRLLGFTLMLI